VLTQYLQAAMRRAHYEILEDDGSFYGEIADCPGVYANAGTLEACREELEQVLGEWVLFRIHRNTHLPRIGGPSCREAGTNRQYGAQSGLRK